MLQHLFFGGTAVGVLLAAGLMPLPERESLPEFTIPDVSLAELDLPDGAALVSNVSAFVAELPELGRSIEETVIRPRLEQIILPVEAVEAPQTPDVRDVVTVQATTPEGETVNFGLNETALDARALELLDALTLALQAKPDARIGIFGHTDLTGAADYNETLGQQRAEQVAAYLKANGIAVERIEVIMSYGETAPAVETEGPERKNRRVHIKMI